MLEDLSERGKAATSSNSWAALAAKYLEIVEPEKGLRCMKRAPSLHSKKKWKPSRPVVNKILGWLGDQGSVEEVEEFVKLLRSVVWANSHMYCAMLKAYVRAGKETDDLLEQMKSDKIKEDDEIKCILAMRKN